MGEILQSLVVPGSTITTEQGFLRGHGSFVDEKEDGVLQLVSSVAGQIERVNKLISVKPIKSRYLGEVGDLVVGRIASVESKRWKVDIASHKDAGLQLSSVNLPDGTQRMRTHEDQLQMRTLFTENDLISAEIQNVSSDGMISLHTRSLKYGKLENGQLIVVPAALIKRLPQHYISLPWGVDVLLGKNGFVWITRTIPKEWRAQEGGSDGGGGDDSGAPLAETLQRLKLRHAETALLRDERLAVARVRNCVSALSRQSLTISPEAISSVYQRSLELEIEPKNMIDPESIQEVTRHILEGR